MDFCSRSGASTPVSARTFSQPSTAPSTPATETSSLFDGQEGFDDDQRYILVTGGLGFIGSHTSLELLKAGFNVLVIDDLSNAFRDVFGRIVELADQYFETTGRTRPQIKLFNINYRNIDAMKALLETYAISTGWREERKSSITGVIHFAAFKAVEESIRQPLRYYRNNVNGLVDFLGLLEDFNIKTFVFSSSATVYGTLADKGLPLQEEHCVHQKEVYSTRNGRDQLAEQGCTGLTNPYGRSKYFGEAILADLAVSDPSWTIVALRYFNPIGCDPSGLLGEDPKGIPSNLLPVVVKVMTGQYPELSVFGTDWNTVDGTAVRDFIHVSDLARGHIAALSAAHAGRIRGNFRTFNLGTGSGHSVMDVVTTMERVAKIPIARRLVGRREGDVGSCVAVADRSSEELGWKTRHSLADACRDICTFLRVSKS